MKMNNIFAIVGLSAAVVLSSCGGGNKAKEDEAARKKREADSMTAVETARQDSIAKADQVTVVNVVETAKADANLSTLVELIGTAGLAEKLSDPNANYTIFAPTNEAFAKVKDLDKLKTDLKKRQELTDILTYHVVSGKFGSADVAERVELDALAEKVIKVINKDGQVTVGGAKIVTADIQASNGIIHVIDVVMTPPKAKGKAKTTTTTPTTTTTTGSTTTGTVTGRGNTGTTTPTGRGTTSTDKDGNTTTSTTKPTGRGNK